MSNVIFDNSTLTAIERLTGEAPVSGWYDIQGDYSALESFLVGLFFHDSYFYIDDYKEEFREQRQNNFNFCRPIPTASFEYDDLIVQAKSLTSDIYLEIKAGRVSPNLLGEFLDTINLSLTAAWHMQSSDFFLTLKVLGDKNDPEEKYSRLTSMIYREINEKAVNEGRQNPPVLLGSDGAEIVESTVLSDGREYEVGPELMSFSNALNWLSHRTAFYVNASSHFDANLSVHPIRHNFLVRWAAKNGIVDHPNTWNNQLVPFFGEQATRTVNLINEVDDLNIIGFNLPLFAAWAVGSTGTVSGAIKFILDKRQSPEAMAIREKFKELEELRALGFSLDRKKALNKIKFAIEREALAMQEKHGISPVAVSSSVDVSASMSLLGPKVTVSGKVPVSNFGLEFGTAKHFRSVFRNVVEDIVGYDSLGDIRTKLRKQINRSGNNSVPKLKVEEEKYVNVTPKSGWKVPM